jgi:hypothetical protein
MAQKTFPQFKFEAYLLMADKQKKLNVESNVSNSQNGNPDGYYQKSTFFEGVGNSVLSKRMWMILSMVYLQQI